MEFFKKHKYNVLLPIALVLAVLTTVFMLFAGGVPQNTNKVKAATTVDESTLQETLPQEFVPTTLEQDGETQEYLIKTVDDLRTLAYWVSTTFTAPEVPAEGDSDPTYTQALAEYEQNIQNQITYTRASFRLENHLDLSAYNWTPIGTESNPFLGNFNGNGKSIYGLTIVTPATDSQDEEINEGFTYYGLFGYVEYRMEEETIYTPHIYSLGLKDTYIKTNGYYVGSIVGYAEGTFDVTPTFTTGSANASVLIEECYNTGYVEGSNYVGGLVGALYTGASIYNCYNMPSSTYETEYGVYTNIVNGSAGGLVGLGVDNSTNRILSQSYNVAVVGAYNLDYAKLGRIMGDQSNVSPALYNRVVFSLSSCLPSDMPYGYDDSVGRAFSSVSSIFSMLSTLGFNYEQTSAGADWKGDATSVWLIATRANSGLPVLYNVPQLIKFDFDAVVIDEDGTEQSILSEDVTTSYASADASKVALTLQDQNSALVEQGNSIFFETTLRSGSAAEKTYQTYSKTEYSWERADYAKHYYSTPTTQELKLGYTFTYNDMTITARYEYKQYNIVFNTTPSDYLDSIYINDTPLQNKTYTTTYVGDDITVQINPVAGYTVKSCSWTAETISANNTVSLDVSACIDSAFNSDTNGSGAINQTITLTPETYNVEITSNRDDCTFSAKLGDTNFVSGSTIQYNQILSLQPETIAENYKFQQWEYQITTKDEEINAENWTVFSTRSDLVTFQIPDCEEDSTIHIRAVFTEQTWSVNIMPTEGGNVTLYSAEFTNIPLNKNEFKFNESFNAKFTATNGYTLTGISINNEIYAVSENTTWFSWVNTDTITFTGLTQNITLAGVFEKDRYNVTVNLVNQDSTASDMAGAQVVNANGDSILGTNNYEYRDRFTLRVILDEGYELVSITANGVPLNNNSVFEVNQYTAITVTVKLKDYQVYSAFDYTENTIYRVDSNNISGSGEYNYGDEVTLNVALPEMFDVAYWVVNGERVNSTETSLTINSITSNLNVVVYLQIKHISITFGASGDADYNNWFTIATANNIINYNGQNTTITLNYGDFVNLSVNSAYYGNGERVGKYTFAYWEVNNAPVNTDRYYTIYAGTQDLNIRAVFIPTDINISGKAAVIENGTITNSGEAGTIIGLNSNYYPYGSTVTLSANANEGYRFAGWYESTTGNSNYELISTNSTYDLVVSQRTTIVAAFEKIAKVTLLTTSNSAGTLQGAGTYALGSTVTVTATANDGYNFVRWLINGVTVSTNPEYQFTLNENTSLSAEFEQVYTIMYAPNDSSYGQIKGNTTGKYQENVTLEAISANNCTFVGWIINDKLVSTDTTLNITLNGDMEVQALFKKNFDWNILIIIAGCLLFAVVLIAASSAYIKMKEAEPMPVRALINGKDDKDVIMKHAKKNSLRDEIEPVPTRKYSKSNIQPVPVRKIVVAPSNHLGQQIRQKDKADNQKPTLKTDVDE